MRKLSIAMVALVAAGLFSQGCSSGKKMSNQDKGVLIGAGSGAVVGGAIGKAAGNTGLGAIIGATVGGVTGGIIGNRMDKQAEEIKKEVPDAKVERVGEGIVVEFSENVLFGYNQSNLSANSYRSLDKLARVLDKYEDTNLEIDGHTDDRGTDAYNQTLSEKRANSVAEYLRSKDIPGSRITTRGYGERYPKYSNATDNGRAGNRRVEFQITANERMKEDARREAGRN